MKINQDILTNDVPADDQTKEKFKVYESPNAVKRVLFLGNSITLHETKPEIGWNYNWGMAASGEEKDYVHLTLQALRKKYGAISYCVCNVGEWEKNYFDENVIKKFDGAKAFAADIVIFRFGENIRQDSFDEYPLLKYLQAFTEYFTENAKTIILTDTFWAHDYICNALKQVATQKGYIFVSLADLGEKAENKAIGLFWHEGVANHPGDLGMQRIAERILQKL